MPHSATPNSFRAGRTLVLAMLGWSDAGEAASEAVEELRRHIGVNRVIRRIDDEDYYEYATHRPRSEFNDEGRRVIRWPATTLTGPIVPQSIDDAEISPEPQRIYTLTGTEPSMRWRTYAREVIEACERESITRIVIVGALLADAPHTRDIQVFLTSDNDQTRTELALEESKYEGPTGIPGVLAHAAREAGMQVVSMWASVPHYTGGTENSSPKAQLAIMDKLSDLLGLEFDRSELLAEAITWEKQITDAVESDEDLQTYVRYLEEARDVVDSDAATGDAIAAEFERFLARDDDEDGAAGRGNEPRS
ncbi:MAG: PAC2 family protein [Gulosibacter sp.]|uniref:PAC2 family protein n=1 Tax=Gulosibacter sp. TaxID=2817531 RepID=UPI003F8E371F